MTPDDTHVPEPPGIRERYYAPRVPAARALPVQPNPETTVTNRLPVQALYGPRGEVIATHDPNPPIGFR